MADYKLRQRTNMRISVSLVFFSADVFVTTATNAGDATSPGESPQSLLLRFTDSRDESHWMQKSGRRPDRYMLAADNAGWSYRMNTLQKLVAHGTTAVPVLLQALKSESVPERILAAQTLGDLAPDVPAQLLLEAAQSDPDAAVRSRLARHAGTNIRGRRLGQLSRQRIQSRCSYAYWLCI